jgi:galactose oxidase
MPLYETGQWESITITDSKATAIHAHLMPNGKIVYFHARYVASGSDFVSCLQAYDDPNPNNIVQPMIPAWPEAANVVEPQNIFCSGHTFLSDGTLFVSGGERPRPPFNSSWRGIKYSYKFNGSAWSTASKMNWGRWYPQLTRLPNGKVVAMSGFSQNNGGEIVLTPEIYDPATNQWTEYSDADMSIPLYNGAYIIPFGSYAGQIFYDLVAWNSGMTQAKRFDPSEADINHWNNYGNSGTSRGGGNSCMLPIRNTDTNAYVVNIGGSEIKASVIQIGQNLNPEWVFTQEMHHGRHDSPNFLLLADGTPVVFGGDHTNFPEKLDYSDPDPENWEWMEIDAEAVVPRKYHSTALLMPDGRVWTGGSRLNNIGAEFEGDMERRIEIYSPGYLFDGNRPVIDSAPSSIGYGRSFEVTIHVDTDPPPTVGSVVLISLPSVTHCFDANQKYVILDFVDDGVGNLTVEAPDNANIAQPGPYMLFVLWDVSESTSGTNRIPSVAKIVILG